MASLSDMGVAEQSRHPARHPFGEEKRVTQHQLLTAFFNHLYLGQWELARACATTLKHLQDSGDGSREPDINAVLKAIVGHPHDIRFGNLISLRVDSSIKCNLMFILVLMRAHCIFVHVSIHKNKTVKFKY